MKLSHLFESTDHRVLLRDVAKELGLSDPHFYDIDDSTSNAADVQAGIDLFHVHLDTDGSAQIKDRIQVIKELAGQSVKGSHSAQAREALEALEGTSFEELPHVKAFHQGLRDELANASKTRDTADTCFKVYFLLSAINGAATTTMSSKHTPDEVRYRAAIAKACMKQLGMKPKALG